MYKLETKQKSKLADFAVNVAVAWFVGSVITPFFSLDLVSQIGFGRMLIGLILTMVFILVSFIAV